MTRRILFWFLLFILLDVSLMARLHQATSQTGSLESTVQIQLTPEEKAWLVGELDAIKNVKDRKNFIKMAAVAPDYNIARFLRERAQMTAIYNQK